MDMFPFCLYIFPNDQSWANLLSIIIHSFSNQSIRNIGLSFFASGMGAWVVYGSTEMGANPALSWFGVIGYSAASACPALIVCMIGPRIRSFTGEKAFCATDYGLARYGRVMQFAIGCISVFYSEYTKTTVRIAMSKKNMNTS